MMRLKPSHSVVAASLCRGALATLFACEARRHSAVATAAPIYEAATNETGRGQTPP